MIGYLERVAGDGKALSELENNRRTRLDLVVPQARGISVFIYLMTDHYPSGPQPSPILIIIHVPRTLCSRGVPAFNHPLSTYLADGWC